MHLDPAALPWKSNIEYVCFMKKVCFVCPLLLLAITALAQNNFVYTNDNFSPNTVSVFQVNPSNGALTLIPGSPFLTGGNGGGRDVNAENMTTAMQGTAGFLYAANNGSSTISAFGINPKTGTLTPVPGSPFDTGAEPEGLRVTANGNFLLVGLRSLDALGVYSIDGNGRLAQVFGSPFLTNGPAVAMDSTCANNRVFVSSAGSNLIDAFDMAADGSLTPVAGSPFPSGGTSTINALTLTPSNQDLLTSDVFNSEVSSLALGQDGSLQPV